MINISNISGFITLTVILFFIGFVIGRLTFRPKYRENKKKKYEFDTPAEVVDRKINSEVLNTNIQESVDGSSAAKEFRKE